MKERDGGAQKLGEDDPEVTRLRQTDLESGWAEPLNEPPPAS